MDRPRCLQRWLQWMYHSAAAEDATGQRVNRWATGGSLGSWLIGASPPVSALSVRACCDRARAGGRERIATVKISADAVGIGFAPAELDMPTSRSKQGEVIDGSQSKIVDRILLAVFAVALVLAVSDLFIVTAGTILLIFAGLLFGIFLGGLSRWLSDHTPLSYRWSYLAVVLSMVLVLGLGAYYMGSQIVQQAAQLSQELKSAANKSLQWLQQQDWAPDAGNLNDMMSKGGGSALAGLTPVLRGVTWGVTGAAVIFFVGLYVAFDPNLYTTGLVKLVPRDRRNRATEMLGRLRWVLERWLIGRLFSMCVIGICTAIVLAVLGVPLPITLGVLAALLTFIPNIGPILAAVPQALLALKAGPNTVYWVILFNIVLQGLESYLLTPMIQRYEVDLPPALTITVQLIFAATIGVIGVMTAAPLTAGAMVVIQMLYIRDRLGDPSPGELADRSEP